MGVEEGQVVKFELKQRSSSGQVTYKEVVGKVISVPPGSRARVEHSGGTTWVEMRDCTVVEGMHIPATQTEATEEPAVAPSGLGGGGFGICVKCGKKCYDAEKAQSTPKNRVYHRSCFACATCGKLLTTNWDIAVGDEGTEVPFCRPHAAQRVKESANKTEYSEKADLISAQAQALALAPPTEDDPDCGLCGEKVSAGMLYKPPRRLVGAPPTGPEFETSDRWKGKVLHKACAGCFKCGKCGTGVELDKVGGIYCQLHLKQRIQTAGGPMRAKDEKALLATEHIYNKHHPKFGCKD